MYFDRMNANAVYDKHKVKLFNECRDVEKAQKMGKKIGFLAPALNGKFTKFVSAVTDSPESFTPEQIEEYLEICAQLVPKVSQAPALVDILYQLAALSTLKKFEYNDVATTLLEQIEKCDTSMNEYRQLKLMTACQALNIPIPAYIDQAKAIETAMVNTETRSRADKILAKEVAKNGFEIEENRFFPVTLSYVDVVASLKINGEKHYFYFQFDGPSHFIQRDEHNRLLNNKGRIQNAMVKHSAAPNEHWIRIDYRSVIKAKSYADLIMDEANLALARTEKRTPRTTCLEGAELDLGKPPSRVLLPGL